MEELKDIGVNKELLCYAVKSFGFYQTLKNVHLSSLTIN
jgi:hypothetical protein